MPCSLQEYLKLIPVTESVMSVIQSIPGAPWILSGLVPWPGAREVPGEPVPVTNHPASEEPFSNVLSELALIQLHSIPSCPFAGSPERDQHLPSTAALEEGAEREREKERLVSPVCQVILYSPWICHPWKDSFDPFVEVTASRRMLLVPQDWRKHRCLVWDRYLNSR